MIRVLAPAAFTFALFGAAQAATLVPNGNFEGGNTGFFSSYDYAPSGNTTASQYTLTDSPDTWNINFADFDDHTPGVGNTTMMLVNGATGSAGPVWATASTITVDQNTNYEFGVWIASAFPTAPAALTVVVNNTTLGSLNAPATTGLWQHFTFQWNSGSDTSAGINMVVTSTEFGGNDFALDDITFTALAPVPLPAGVWLLAAGLGGFAALRRRT